MNGDILRHRQTCSNSVQNPQAVINIVDKQCAEFRLAAHLNRRIHYYFVGKPVEMSNDITLMTQFTIDRWTAFEKFAGNWPGPVIGVLHGTDEDSVALLNAVKRSKPLLSRSNIAYHFVFQQQVSSIVFCLCDCWYNIVSNLYDWCYNIVLSLSDRWYNFVSSDVAVVLIFFLVLWWFYNTVSGSCDWCYRIVFTFCDVC